MPQDFYTLEEAAQQLGITPQALLDMAKPGPGGAAPQVRSFMDRGVPRFSKEEIHALARKSGDDLALPGFDDGPAAGVPTAPIPGDDLGGDDVFTFDPDPEAEAAEAEAGGDADIFAGFATGAPHTGADSEINLAMSNDDLNLDVLPTGDELGADKPATIPAMNLAPPVIPSAAGEDDEASVPLGREHEHATSDSDIDLGAPVQPKTGSGKLPPDSGVRLVEDWLMAKDQIAQSGLSGLGLAKTSGPKSKPPSGKIPAPQPAFNLAPEPPKAPPTPAAKAKSPAKDSDAFDLQPLADLNPADSVFDASHNQAAGGPKSKPKTQPSIDLDQDEETISFDLAPDAAESSGNTMRRKMAQSGKQPAPAPAAADEGSSEFDLSPLQEEGSSEFDLTPLKEASDSSSEFELTLDDDAGLAPMEEEKPKPKAKAKAPAGGAKKPAAKAEASDLELSPLEEDTNLESSDFELAVEEDSSTTDNDTSSEVVVVEDGDLGDSPLEENVVVEEDGAEVVGVVEDEEEGAPVVAAVAAPAEWGWWSLFHVPTAVVMLFTGFLLMEMMRSIYSYQQPGPVGTAVFDMINKMFK